MSIAGKDDRADPLVSSLQSLFAQASIKVALSGLEEEERNREIAFYDEILPVAIRISIPASEKTLPFPASSSSRTSFSLPINRPSEDDEEKYDAANAPPYLLALLVSALQVTLEASYTAPRLSASRKSMASSIQAEVLSSSTYLVPATSRRDAAYQSVPLQQQQGSDVEVTQMFSSSWKGDRTPEDRKNLTEKRKSGPNTFQVEGAHNGGDIWYVQAKGEGSWITEWRCRLPVVFMRTRHPTPALVLTASLRVRLQPTHLNRAAPHLRPPLSSTSASESLYLHDLLSPLSEGPAYPDESPAERAARANASLAKLPLGKLPSSILGSKLVTPARNAKDVGHILAQKTRTEDGDMGDSSDDSQRNDLQAGRRDLTNDGLMAYKLANDADISAASDDHANGLGEEVLTLQRSTRRVMDVQSAILVRMRTITVPDFPQDSDDMLVPTMILCVEVENPANSGIKYSLERVDVLVASTPPVASEDGSVTVSPIHITLRRIGEPCEPILVDQGSQLNLLYRIAIDCGMADEEDIIKSCSQPHRSVSIKLLGKPSFLQLDESATIHTSSIKNFVSTWTCTLDLAMQMKVIALRKVMHDGGGGTCFRGRKAEMPLLPLPRGVHSTLYSGAYASPLSPVPSSAVPRTPGETRTASTLMPPSHRFEPSSPHSASLRRPSLRSATGNAQSDTFVSLHRNVTDKQEASAIVSPALPSALVGQSILARARLSRSAMMATTRAEESRDLLMGNSSSQDHHMKKTRNTSEATVTSARKPLPPFTRTRLLHGGSVVTGSYNGDSDVDPRFTLYPLNDRQSTTLAQRLLFSPTSDEGILVDVVAHVQPYRPSEDGLREVWIKVQMENRSEYTRTLIVSWRLPTITPLTSPLRTLQIQDDDIQVGPLQSRDSEVVVIKLRCTKTGLQPLPPLSLYDTTSGTERVLQSLQSIVI